MTLLFDVIGGQGLRVVRTMRQTEEELEGSYITCHVKRKVSFRVCSIDTLSNILFIQKVSLKLLMICVT